MEGLCNVITLLRRHEESHDDMHCSGSATYLHVLVYTTRSASNDAR